jgi:hypothetical protein
MYTRMLMILIDPPAPHTLPTRKKEILLSLTNVT